jgi:hypothetical protein
MSVRVLYDTTKNCKYRQELQILYLNSEFGLNRLIAGVCKFGYLIQLPCCMKMQSRTTSVQTETADRFAATENTM